MYSVKKEYICIAQTLFHAVAKSESDKDGSLVTVFPQVAIELSGGDKNKLEPLAGDIYGDLFFGYGIKWLAYLIQEGEIIVDKGSLGKSLRLLDSAAISALEKCTGQMAFEICPFNHENAARFIDLMESKYPYMPLPTVRGNREELVDAFYSLYNVNHYIGISGGIKIEE